MTFPLPVTPEERERQKAICASIAQLVAGEAFRMWEETECSCATDFEATCWYHLSNEQRREQIAANLTFILWNSEPLDSLLSECSRLRAENEAMRADVALLDRMESEMRFHAENDPEGETGFWLMYNDERNVYPGFYVDLANRDRPHTATLRDAIRRALSGETE